MAQFFGQKCSLRGQLGEINEACSGVGLNFEPATQWSQVQNCYILDYCDALRTNESAHSIVTPDIYLN